MTDSPTTPEEFTEYVAGFDLDGNDHNGWEGALCGLIVKARGIAAQPSSMQLDTADLKLTAGDTITETHIRIIAAWHERGVLLGAAASRVESDLRSLANQYARDIAHIQQVHRERVMDAQAQ